MKLGTIIYVSGKEFEKIQKSENQWDAFCSLFLYDERFPTLLGGLDRIENAKNQITFHDIGVNHKDNTFTIRRKKEEKL